MIASGVNAKALSIYMGHPNISITLDRDGHLMRGNEVEAATLLEQIPRAVPDRHGAGPRYDRKLWLCKGKARLSSLFHVRQRR